LGDFITLESFASGTEGFDLGGVGLPKVVFDLGERLGSVRKRS